MRNFDKLEKSVITKWVDARLAHQIEKLSVGSIILDQQKGVIAVEWDSSSVKVVHNKGAKPVVVLGALFDVLLFVKYLDDNGAILSSKSKHSETDSNRLYNEIMYERRANGEYWSKCKDGIPSIKIMGESYKFEFGISNHDTAIVYCDLYKLLNKYAHSLAYPSHVLIEYVQNGFKTQEQQNFDKQMRLARYSLFVSWAAFIVALLPEVCDRFNPDITIRELNETIKCKKLPEIIKTEVVNDTLNTFVFNLKSMETSE